MWGMDINMGKARITNHQLFSLEASSTCGSAILVISSSAASIAKQDSWISILLMIVLGLLDIWLICFLWSHYPNMTYAEILKDIYGKWIGSIFISIFVFFCLVSSSQVLWYVGNFINVQAMPETPEYFINMVFIAAVVIALLYGIEVIVRSYEIFIYLISFLFVVSMIMVLPNAKIDYLLPVFEKGIAPTLKGTFLLSTYIVFPAILLLIIFPVNAANTLKAKISFVKGYLWGGFLLFISIFVSILVLGSTMTENSQFPVYRLAKEINLGTVFTRMEFVVAAVWIITLLSKEILYFYAGIMSLSQLLKLKDHKKIILPLGLIVLTLSGVVYPDVIYQASWDTYVWPAYSLTFFLVLPLTMLVGYYIKKFTND